jgi:hypothetical protein
MTAFSRTVENGVVVWRGEPSCQDGHDSILEWLEQHGAIFLASSLEFSERIKGNLGETISFCLGKWFDYQSHIAFPANVFQVIVDISRPAIDIVWLFFGTVEENDVAVIQEVKTTGAPSLDYADALIPDYEKLFGTDPSLRLQNRLQAIKNEVEYKLNRPEWCARISNLAGMSPQTSPRIRLVPTLVHELSAADPVPKMVAIRTTLVGKGWPIDAIDAWAVGLSELNPRLIRLAQGQS